MRWVRFALLTALLRPVALQAQTHQVPTDSASLSHIADLVERYYWRPLSHDSLLMAMRAGGLAALDPYSELFSRTELIFFSSALHASFGGIGVRLDRDSLTGQFRFLGTYAGSPAQAAGLRPADALLSIDGALVAGHALEQVRLAMRGPVGSPVTIDVRHAADTVVRRVVIRRSVIHTPSLHGAQHAPMAGWDYHLSISDSVAYVRIMYFSETTAAELDSALASIGHSGARALILDLRDNAGGLTSAATQAADLFLDSGVVVTFRGRTPPDDIVRAEPGVSSRLPLAILINANTISSAELFAAALQDNHRALIVGARSFGKGMVQRIFSFPDSSGALKLTIAAYLRPSGRPIERHVAGMDSTLGGVWPDSGMAVVDTRERAAAVTARLLESDDLGLLLETLVQPPSPAEDAALARAYAALVARLAH